MSKTFTLFTRVVMVMTLLLSASMMWAENQAWVGYDASSQTLTFHYDEKKASATGVTTFNLPTKENPEWSTYASQIEKVVFESSFAEARPTTCANWFNNMNKVTEIQGLGYLHTDAATSLKSMFLGCTSLTSVDLTGFVTTNVKTMSGMFQYCRALKQIDLSGFNTENVTDMSDMFNGCSKLTSLDLSSFDVKAVTTMSRMFNGCSALTSLNLSSFKKVYATEMEQMFTGCSALTTLDLSRFYAVQPKVLTSMFQNCSKLEKLDLSYFHNDNVTDAAYMFNGCSSLSEIAVSQSFTLPTACNGTYMFSGCKKLTGYNEDEDGIEKAKYISEGGYLTEHEVTKPWTVLDDNGTLTFYYNDEKEYSDATNKFSVTAPPMEWESYTGKVVKVVFDPGFTNARPTTCASWFKDMEGLTDIQGLDYLNTSAATDMHEMFYACESLTSLDLSTFNTENVINMSDMFWACNGLTQLDVSSFNTEKVTSMKQMFYSCESLETLDLKNFKTENVTNMAGMFGDCLELTALDVSSFNTSKVTDMFEMFQSCSSLTSLDLSGFYTSEVTDMEEMFDDCQQITELNLSKFNTSKLKTAQKMFASCSALSLIYVSPDFVIPDKCDGSGMFRKCTSLPNYNSEDEGEEMANYETGYLRLFEPWVAYDATTKTLSFFCNGNRQTANATVTYAIPTTSVKTPAWLEYRNDIEAVVIDSSFVYAHPIDCQSWFFEMTNLKTITGIQYLNTSEVTNMSNMFYQCSSLTDLDLQWFQTDHVTDMSRMFSNCTQLTQVDLSSFHTKQVTDMSSMFYACAALKNIFASDPFVVSTTCTGPNMFYGCASLEGYSESKVDTAYAKYTTEGGYFTQLSEEPEAWVVFDETTGTLTFRYDKKRPVVQSSHKYLLTDVDETTADLVDPSMVTPAWHAHAKDVLRVEFTKDFADVRPTTCSFWFYNMNRLKNIQGMEYLNTSEATAMAWMFMGCDSLSEISRTLTNLSTAKVTNMRGMFAECEQLTELNLTSFNTENVTNMADMFNGCIQLKSVNLSRFNTARVTDMSDMFYNCHALESLNLSNFNTSNVTKMEGMFYDCSSLASLDLSMFNTAKVTTMYRMFRSCSALTELDLSSFKTTVVTNMSNMFNGCSSLVTLDLSSFNPSSTDITWQMFYQCDKLQTIYASDNFVVPESCDGKDMFAGCISLPEFKAENVGKEMAVYTTLGGYLTACADQPWAEFDASKGTLTFYYNNKKKATSAKAYDLNEGNNLPGWNTNTKYITRVVFDETFAEARPTSCSSWFMNLSKLTGIDGLEYLNTSNVTSMYRMFYNYPLETLDLSHLNTSNVTTMQEMFMSSSSLQTLDLTGFNTSNVTTMENMFRYCNALTSVDLSSFNTSKVTNMQNMFFYCNSVTSLDLTSFDTENVTDMSSMFYGCIKMDTVDLSSFNTASLQTCKYMFSQNKDYLKETALKTIYASDLFQIPESCDAYGMFIDCDSLPSYDAKSYGKEKAVDTSKGGYLTLRRLFYVGDTPYAVDGTEAICHKDVTFTDGDAFISRFDFAFDADNTASYTRNVSNHWATLCLPFAFSVDENDAACYSVSQYDKDNLTVTRIKEDVPAGTPVLVYTNGNSISISSKGAAAVAQPVENDVLVGVFVKTIVADEDYIISKDHFWNALWLKDNASATNVYVAPYRAYLKLNFTGETKPNSISISEGEATDVHGIETIDTIDNLFDGAELYDLQGRRLSAPTRGIVIVRKNGATRKVLVR